MHQENNYGLDTLANLLHETAIEKGFGMVNIIMTKLEISWL